MNSSKIRTNDINTWSEHQWMFFDSHYIRGVERDLHTVQHDYHDYSTELDDASTVTKKHGNMVTFPIKLHILLETIERDGYAHVISWQPHGRCFVVHKPREFTEYVMPVYFKQTKFPSFQRQLNLYGFQRLTKGVDKGGYYNELFLRGKLFLAHRIQRIKIKGNCVRARSNPDAEPNFQKIPPVVSSSKFQNEKEEFQTIMAIQCSTLRGGEINDSATFDNSENDRSQPEKVSADEFGNMKFFPIESMDLEESTQSHKALLDSTEVESFLRNLNIPLDLYVEVIQSVHCPKKFSNTIMKLIH